MHEIRWKYIVIGASCCVVYSKISCVKTVEAKETVILLAQKQDYDEDNKAFVETYQKAPSEESFTPWGEDGRVVPHLCQGFHCA